MEINFTSDFDHKLVEDAIKNSNNQEGARKSINFLSEAIAQPAQDVVKISFFFKESVSESMHIVDKDKQETISKGIYHTFVASVFGNLISLFNISEKDALNLVRDVVKQNSNIKKQNKEDS